MVRRWHRPYARALWLMLLVVVSASPVQAQKFDQLAQTPPMGWNSWNHYGCQIDEKLIRDTADAMVANGMRDAGYVYVNIDDCWQGERDNAGLIHADPVRFPSGIKALADYIHARGLKLGLYSDAGIKTCGGRPGSQGHEYQDAAQYARWGVDYLKYDWCNTGTGADQRNPREAYATMRDALRAAGRPIVFSICEWGDSKPWEWAADIGHLWRTTGDITNCFDCLISHGGWFSSGILQILDKQDGLRKHAGPGHWNDPDMLEVGNLPSLAEDRSNFAMWAMLAAPLIVGTDVVAIKPEVLRILTNPGLIAIDQDRLGIEGFAWKKELDREIWVRPLANGEWAIALLNRSNAAQSRRIDWHSAAISDDLSQRSLSPSRKYRIIDLWSGKVLGDTSEALAISVAARDTAVVLLQPE